MTDEELLSLLKDLESDRVERKSSGSDSDKIREAICAFANDLPNHRRPGVVFVGVDDAGRSTRIKVDDRLLLTLGNLRDDGNIQPIPSMVVERRELGGDVYVVVIVEPSRSPPVRYRGRTWIRTGPRRAVATPEEELRLTERRRSRDLPFDARPFSGARLEDLDLRYFEEEYLPQAIAADVLRANGRSREQRLASLRFSSPDAEPTALGLLITGHEPQGFLAGAYVQFTRFQGQHIENKIRDSKRLAGTLPEQLRRLDDLISLNISTPLELVPGTERVTRDYPQVAIQELVRNALMHRNYETSNAPVRIYWFDDRIEIYNPGGPYGQVTRQSFGSPGLTDYRNPHVAEAMRVLGYAQKFGVGIATAQRELRENGNPPAEFQVEETSIMTLLRRRP
ncbi:MAG: putative DNA binding domain-containing protein [Polyangiaceae bacterium]|jgi:ATP-dependent DNA helicase RecG|nr:putative DNA binding domain-containing protein [Polyangiaceae bacterium]